jgi:hypothetical protein
VKHWDLGQRKKLAIPVDGLSKSVIVINDSQAFGNLGLRGQKAEFAKWVDFYSPNPVGFQLGYPSDLTWWHDFIHPVRDNAVELAKFFGTANSARQLGFIWVDFSVRYPMVNKYLANHDPIGE